MRTKVKSKKPKSKGKRRRVTLRPNCWDFTGCGREPGGAKVMLRGVCPAATASRAHGIHGGTNGGRICWAIAGTLCDGRVAGTYAAKMATCAVCDFHRLVREEEQVEVLIDEGLLTKLT